MKVFASASPAPAARTKEARKISLIYACVLAVFAVSQLVTYSDFLTYFSSIGLPGSIRLAHFLASFIIVAEVFSLPFLFRMRLSPLARFLSMVLSWIVPALWLFVSIWILSTVNSISTIEFLGSFVAIIPGWWTIFISLALGLIAAWSSYGLWPYQQKKVADESN